MRVVGKCILIVLAVCTVWIDGAFCATARRGTAAQSSAPKTTAARAATNSRTAPKTATTATKTGGRTTAARSGVPASSAAPKAPVVSARAAATQKVIGTGTKVAGATENTAVGSDCQNLYNACMDAFCIVDNVDGGRCACSDKYKSFEALLTQVDDLNNQAYKISTVGMESVESVVTKDAALQVGKISNLQKTDLQKAWENGDVGGALRKTAIDACAAKLPQCANELTILSGMYSGKINGDCVAYENSIKKLLADAKARLNQAEVDLRSSALDVAKNANKYDLGQCTIKFRECMQTTAECGADFTGCVDTTEQTKSRIKKTQAEEIFVIPNTTAKLTISKSMYELLMAKSVVCSSVLDNCVAVRDSVFDAFLRESAPLLTIAENLAESNARQNCITKVSDCFQNACRDNIDPDDKDASYDACLTRPETMLSFCKVELDACGVDASSAAQAKKSEIWDYVLAKLAALKVDACTEDLKDCLTDESRCGADYSNCVGLSTEQIIRMCPYDKLTGCKNVYDNELTSDQVYENLTNVVQGIILNIDNELLAVCQAAVDNAAVRACGENLDCGNLINLDTIGTTSLDYKICEVEVDGGTVSIKDNCFRDVSMIPDNYLGRVEGTTTGEIGKITATIPVVEPMIFWEKIDIGSDGMLTSFDDYIKQIDTDGTFEITDLQRERLAQDIQYLQTGITQIKDIIHMDAIVNACINGGGIKGISSEKTGRFPNITNSTMMLLSNKLLKRAKNNYYSKYDEYAEKSVTDTIQIVERIYKMRDENAKDARREIARKSCVNLAEISAIPKQKSTSYRQLRDATDGLWAAAGAAGLTAAISAATIPATTLGGLVVSVLSALISASLSVIAGIAEGVLQSNDGILDSTMETSDKYEYAGAYKLSEFNHKEDITTIFDPINITCEKCVVTTECTKVLIVDGRVTDQCLNWGEPVKNCRIIQF